VTVGTEQQRVDLDAFLALAATFKPWKPGPRRAHAPLRDRAFAEVVRSPVLGRADLRLNGLLSPPKQQGMSNACTSFAIAAAAEAAVRKKLRPPVTLAPWFIHTCLMHCPPDQGVYIGAAMPNVLGAGIAFTSDSDQPFPETLCGTPDRLPLAGAYQVPDAQAAKAALDNKDVVVCTIFVRWADFAYLAPNAVYAYDPDAQASTHSVCLVGYDDAAGYWIIQNSQGAGWSDHGFGRIAYDTCGLLASPGSGDAAVVLA